MEKVDEVPEPPGNIVLEVEEQPLKHPVNLCCCGFWFGPRELFLACFQVQRPKLITVGKLANCSFKHKYPIFEAGASLRTIVLEPGVGIVMVFQEFHLIRLVFWSYELIYRPHNEAER